MTNHFLERKALSKEKEKHKYENYIKGIKKKEKGEVRWNRMNIY